MEQLVLGAHLVAGVDHALLPALAVGSGGGDDALKAIARIRLAGVLIEQKNYADAAKVLDATFPAEFVGLAADRRGDLAVSQGKPDEARAQYGAAYKAMDERTDYRRMVEVKLNALGVDPTPPAVIAPASAAAPAAVPKVAPPAAAASAVASAPAVAPASGVSK